MKKIVLISIALAFLTGCLGEIPKSTENPYVESKPRFKPKQKVMSITDPNTRGVVVSSSGETATVKFDNGSIQVIYTNNLKEIPAYMK